jgi:hypothetical protein
MVIVLQIGKVPVVWKTDHVIDSIHYPSRINATQWQHTPAQRQRLGKRKQNG